MVAEGREGKAGKNKMLEKEPRLLPTTDKQLERKTFGKRPFFFEPIKHQLGSVDIYLDMQIIDQIIYDMVMLGTSDVYSRGYRNKKIISVPHLHLREIQ